MGLTDKHLAYGDDIPQTQTEKDYYWKINRQQPCDDCISRQTVLEVLKNNRYRFNISQEGYCEGKVLWSENLIKEDARKEIEQLPPVTPKEKTGKWVEGGYEDMYYVCSECDYKASEYWYKPFYKYCPNCGAKMIEPQESEVSE